MIKAIAIDDETPALKVIESFCSQAENIELEKTFTSPNEALKYLRKFPVDLIFLDINMPSITGIAASGPMSPRPRTLVPSDTTATIFALFV